MAKRRPNPFGYKKKAGGGARYTTGWRPSGDWGKAYAALDRQTRLNFLRRMDRKMVQIGEGIAAHIRAGMNRGGVSGYRFRPLHTFTMARRSEEGSSAGTAGAPLVASGKLRNAVKSRRLSWLTVFVGVADRSSRGGISLGRLAAVQEEGIFIKITPAMRKWLMEHDFGDHADRPQPARADGKPGWIRIPPRPFIKPYFRDPRLVRPIRKLLVKTSEMELWEAIHEEAGLRHKQGPGGKWTSRPG